MDSIYYIFYKLFFKPVLKIYLRTDSLSRFDGFRLKISKGVFHPKLFFSTRYFYSFIKELELTGVRFLEIGSGSGILSLLAKRKGASVSAVDIDENAVETTRFNFLWNFTDLSNVTILKSDVLSALSSQLFDVIVINPPYYFKKVDSPSQYAWYCGENGEYFYKLFSQLTPFLTAHTGIFMVLADNCDIKRIEEIAGENHFKLEQVAKKKIRWEINYIFKLSAIHSDLTVH